MYIIDFFRYKLDTKTFKEDKEGIESCYFVDYYEHVGYDDLDTVFTEIKKFLNNSYGYVTVNRVKMRIDNFKKFKEDMLKNKIILLNNKDNI
jgi:hypothetical protein